MGGLPWASKTGSVAAPNFELQPWRRQMTTFEDKGDSAHTHNFAPKRLALRSRPLPRNIRLHNTSHNKHQDIQDHVQIRHGPHASRGNRIRMQPRTGPLQPQGRQHGARAWQFHRHKQRKSRRPALAAFPGSSADCFYHFGPTTITHRRRLIV